MNIYGMHKNADGKVLTTAAFGYSFELDKWMRALDVRAGDRIEFEEVTVREIESAPVIAAVA